MSCGAVTHFTSYLEDFQKKGFARVNIYLPEDFIRDLQYTLISARKGSKQAAVFISKHKVSTFTNLYDMVPRAMTTRELKDEVAGYMSAVKHHKEQLCKALACNKCENSRKQHIYCHRDVNNKQYWVNIGMFNIWLTTLKNEVLGVTVYAPLKKGMFSDYVNSPLGTQTMPTTTLPMMTAASVAGPVQTAQAPPQGHGYYAAPPMFGTYPYGTPYFYSFPSHYSYPHPHLPYPHVQPGHGIPPSNPPQPSVPAWHTPTAHMVQPAAIQPVN
ncbi:hypothetical protein K439DRAFT_1617899 [Ramaria rubella]|nr:hypothetical protein K439DRAFT_1617899 [Ramaria rubella]